MPGKPVKKLARRPNKLIPKKVKTLKKNIPKKTPPKVVEEVEEEVEEVEDVEDVDEAEEEVPKEKKRSPRKKPTLDSYVEKMDVLIGRLTKEIDQRAKPTDEDGRGGKDTKFLKSIRRELDGLRKQAPKVIASKRGVSRDGKSVSGFILPCEISPELAAFIGVDPDSTPSRGDVTNAVCAYIRLKDDEKREHMLKWKHLNPNRERDLQNPYDKMAIKPDKALSKLLNYDQYCEDVTNGLVTIQKKKQGSREKEEVTVKDSSLKYYVLQKLLKPHIIRTIPVPASSK
ncbi:SWIB/MDM2 domain-containing protein [bacterium]|nr:SWIB/MDM2 domain-containing protein [bacterium]